MVPSVFLPGHIFARTIDPSLWLTYLPGPAVGCGLLTSNYPAHIILHLISGVPAAEGCEETIKRGLCWLGAVFVGIPKPRQETLALE